jgi:8-amino-3,8-dideoxy-alpha-D-manno-octulosonate transaminase
VLAEVDDTLNLDPTEIARLCTPRTRAVLVVHYQGVPADMDAILTAARSANLRVIEDCAESAGATFRGRPVGSIGDIGTFSFQTRKIISAGEGGMIVTADPHVYERAVRMSDVGQYRAFHEKQHPASGPAFSGSNYRMSELTAAVALAQFRRLPRMVAHLRALRERLVSGIGQLAGVSFRRIPDSAGDLGFETYLYLPNAETVTKLRALLAADGVNCSQHTGTYCHYARPYCQSGAAHAPGASPFTGMSPWPAPGYRQQDFPRTNALITRMMAVPLGVLYRFEDVDVIAAAICKATASVLGATTGRESIAAR